MADIKGIILSKILNKEEGYLEAWSKLKLGYFGTEYLSIYKALSKFYIKHSNLPSFEELELYNRSTALANSIKTLQDIEVPDVALDLAVDALLDEYTQNEVLDELDTFLNTINILDSSEIKEELSKIILRIEEKTLSAEEIVLMNDIEFTTDQELLGLMPLGLNNTFDAEVMGMAPTEVLAIGGARGSGKSNVLTNLCINQYEAGNTSVYFSIEMRAREVFNRQLSLLSGVPLSNLTKASCSEKELELIAKTRACMFQDAEGLVDSYLEHRDFNRFEKELCGTKELTPDNQLIIVDNQNLSLANIDLTLQKFKAQFGDSLKLVAVDYLNVIAIEDKYDWKVQIAISAKLKEIARKYNIILATAYQIDKTGEARFSKGILDSVDIAMTLERSEGRIDFESSKTRNMKAFKMASPINEETMRIDPNDSNLPIKEEEPKKEKEKEPANDIPWS